MAVKNYVQENFTKIEQEVFNYMLTSFPESVLVVENQESQDILALIATLAKIIGSSKELILNLKTGHSLEEVINKIENEYLVENNRQLILPLADDAKYHRLFDNLETDELIDQVIKEKPFVLNYYNLYKNRGTLTAINQIVRKFAVFLGQVDVAYNIYELNNEIDIVIENLSFAEEFIDFAAGDEEVILNGNTFSVVPIKKDSVIFDMLLKIKPVGFVYKILFKYAINLLINSLDNRVIGLKGRKSTFAKTQRLTTASLESATPDIVAIQLTGDNEYEVTLKNTTPVAIDAFFADWSDNNIFKVARPFPNFDTPNFLFYSERLLPSQEKTIAIASVDPNFSEENQFLSVYATNIDDRFTKSITLFVRFGQNTVAFEDPVLVANNIIEELEIGAEVTAVQELNDIQINPPMFNTSSIDQTENSISGTVSNSNVTVPRANLETQIRFRRTSFDPPFVDNETGWTTLETTNVLKNNIPFNLTGLAAASLYEIQIRNVTSTENFLSPSAISTIFRQTTTALVAI